MGPRIHHKSKLDAAGCATKTADFRYKTQGHLKHTMSLGRIARTWQGDDSLWADLGRMRRTARPSLSLTGNLNCFPVSASGSISVQVIASG